MFQPEPIHSMYELTQVSPKPELEKRSRRKFSDEYKWRIVAEADFCQHGELTTLLRRKKLYSNQLRDWRAELRQTGAEGLSKREENTWHPCFVS